jgi:hypothetical protein
MTEFQMMLFLVGVHIFGFIAVGLLMIPALRDDNSDAGDDSGSSDDGWGNRPNVRPDPGRWPGGGIPLPDAEQSSVRFRGPGRLGDRLSSPRRRPAHDPAPRKPVRAND